MKNDLEENKEITDTLTLAIRDDIRTFRADLNRAACIGRTGVIRRDDPTFRISVKDSLWYGNGDVFAGKGQGRF